MWLNKIVKKSYFPHSLWPQRYSWPLGSECPIGCFYPKRSESELHKGFKLHHLWVDGCINSNFILWNLNGLEWIHKLMSTRLPGKVVRTCPIAHRVCMDLRVLLVKRPFNFASSRVLFFCILKVTRIILYELPLSND